MRRRLLILLLLVLALAGGLWWNSTQLTALNETEQRLVGVWEYGEPPATLALILRKDRKRFFAERVGKDDWVCGRVQLGRWHASSGSLTFRDLVATPTGSSFSEWEACVKSIWNGEHRRIAEIVRLTDDEFTVRFPHRDSRTYRHSIDPDLLRIYYQLNAGKSP